MSYTGTYVHNENKESNSLYELILNTFQPGVKTDHGTPDQIAKPERPLGHPVFVQHRERQTMMRILMMKRTMM